MYSKAGGALMKVKRLQDIPDSTVAAVAYQVFSDSVPLHWTYKGGVVAVCNKDFLIPGDLVIIEQLENGIANFLRKSSYEDVKIVGGYSSHDHKYHIWYVTSHGIVLPWISYYTQLSLASPYINCPPVFMGPYSFFKNFDLECLDTDLGNMLIVHNMERSSSFIYMDKIL
jgi:hypothetical protein